MRSATALRSPAPRSSSSSDRKYTWNSTSPSSSTSLSSSPLIAASASSYASSTVCGTIERSSCSRSHGHSTRSLRVISSRRARLARAPSSTGLLPGGRGARVRRLLLRGGGLRRLAGSRRRRRLLLRSVAAVRDQVGLRALHLVLVVLAELGDEVVQRLLLVLRLQEILDRLLGLPERLLRRRSDLRHLEDVVAELRLDRTDDRAFLGAEDRGVEGLLLLPLGHAGQLAALRLGGLVDRVLLRDGRPALAAVEGGLRGAGLGLGARQDDQQVAALRLSEALLVLVVVARDLRVGDLVLALDDLRADIVGDDVELHAEEQVGLGHARVLEELLVVRILLERLLLLVLELLLDFLVGDLDVLLFGLLLDPLGRNEELHDLLLQRVVLLLALGLELPLRRLLRAVRDRLLGQVRGALREVGRIGDRHVRTRRRRAVGRGVQPVVELRLGDDTVTHLGDPIAGNVRSAAGDERGAGRDGQCDTKNPRHSKKKRS